MPKLEEIEDIDDIDDLEMDIAEFDPELKTALAPARPKPEVKVEANDGRSESSNPLEQMMKSMGIELPTGPDIPEGAEIVEGQGPNALRKSHVVDPRTFSEEELKEFKSMNLLYPCYFDRSRSEKQGRRVKKPNAVENPLAKSVLDACLSLGLHCILEAEKSHPQDFGNPGRVRVYLKDPDGKIYNDKIKNKRHLMIQVSSYLQAHKTTPEMVKELPSAADLQGFVPEPIVKVKGFKQNTIVPLHSPLLMKHPQTKSIYEKQPEVATPAVPKVQKQKIQRIRG